MYSRPFKALLKSVDNRLLATGMARISFDNQSVDFRSDFIPLLKMGVPAKVVRVIDKEETHCFDGSVYLSSKKLLRLVDVKDQILADVELELMATTAISAVVVPHITESRLFRSPLGRLLRFDVSIYSISTTSVKFTSAERFEVGEQLLLRSDTPVQLRKVLLEVYQIISFGDKVTGHRCKVLTLNEQSRKSLGEYMGRMNHFFPDAADEELDDAKSR